MTAFKALVSAMRNAVPTALAVFSVSILGNAVWAGWLQGVVRSEARVGLAVILFLAVGLALWALARIFRRLSMHRDQQTDAPEAASAALLMVGLALSVLAAWIAARLEAHPSPLIALGLLAGAAAAGARWIPAVGLRTRVTRVDAEKLPLNGVLMALSLPWPMAAVRKDAMPDAQAVADRMLDQMSDLSDTRAAWTKPFRHLAGMGNVFVPDLLLYRSPWWLAIAGVKEVARRNSRGPLKLYLLPSRQTHGCVTLRFCRLLANEVSGPVVLRGTEGETDTWRRVTAHGLTALTEAEVHTLGRRDDTIFVAELAVADVMDLASIQQVLQGDGAAALGTARDALQRVARSPWRSAFVYDTTFGTAVNAIALPAMGFHQGRALLSYIEVPPGKAGRMDAVKMQLFSYDAQQVALTTE